MTFGPVVIILVIIATLLAAVIYLLLSLQASKKREKSLSDQAVSLENKINAIELGNVQYRLNPHLFKNILNSIQSHAYQTYISLEKLSNVLDYILYESNRNFVTVHDEVQFALSLIEINKLKLSPLFDIQVKNKLDETSPLYNQELMAPLITADLIENAFKHAEIHSPEAFITISFEIKDGVFFLTVANRISPKPTLHKTHGGIGKENTRKRLEILYKGCYSLRQFEEQGVFISQLKIDFIEYKSKVFAAG